MGLLYKIALGVLAWEGVSAWTTQRERKRVFAAAQDRAKLLGRPLLVIGDPDAGFIPKIFSAYGCGDACVDLHGCPSCPVQHEVDITKGVPFADDSSVAFVSCVLEYVTDIEAAWRELRRVTGDPVNLFVVIVPKWSLASYIFPGARWRLSRAGVGFTAVPTSGPPGDGRLLGYP